MACTCDTIWTAYCNALTRLDEFDANCIHTTTTEEGETVQWNATRSGLVAAANALMDQYQKCVETQSTSNNLFYFSSRGIAKQCNRPLQYIPECCDDSGCELEP